MMLPSLCAGVAQLVEHFLAKEDVASSSLVTRFRPLVPRRLQRGTARYLDLVCKVHSTQRAKASRRSSALAERRRTYQQCITFTSSNRFLCPAISISATAKSCVSVFGNIRLTYRDTTRNSVLGNSRYILPSNPKKPPCVSSVISNPAPGAPSANVTSSWDFMKN